MSPIILASASPRRKELLEQIKLSFEIRVSACEEVITKTIPYDIVMELSDQKATDISTHLSETEKEDCIIIGADTIVAYEDQILGKPSSPENAYEMLQLLSGKIHQVYTGVTLIKYTQGKCRKNTFYEKTDVYFYPLTEEEINTYIASGNCMDKAGAYGIQCEAAAFVEKIDGDYNNVVGLPIARLLREIKTLS